MLCVFRTTCIFDHLAKFLSQKEKMAVIETNMNNSLHIRSNSLPSAPHPFVLQFEDHFNRLKDSEATSSASSIRNKLNGLEDLNDCIDKLLQLPSTQQALAGECNNNDRFVDELLDRSLRLLDICSTAQDCLIQLKEKMHELESVIRRRRDAETGFTVEAGKYISSRKHMKKAIQKVLGNLKGFKKDFSVSSLDKDDETLSMLRILKEAEVIAMNSLESLLMFIIGSKGQSKQNKWSMISKLMQPNRVECESQESSTNEFEKVDESLKSLMSYKHSSIEDFQGHMENLEMCIQDLESGFEGLSRKLIRTRVSLLNIFNH